MATPSDPSALAGAPPTPVSFSPGEGRVVILGGGYGGVSTARELLRLGHPAGKILIIDRERTTTFRTELYKVGEALAAPPGSLPWSYPFERTRLAGAGVEFRQAEVTGLDVGGKRVLVAGEPIPYDVLVIALGCVPAYYGIPGCEANSFQVYTVKGAVDLAAKLSDLLRTPGGGPARVLVAGGGATGVELGAYITTAPWGELLHAEVRAAKVTVLSGPAPFLAGMPEPLIQRARKELTKAGLEVLDGGQVVSVRPGHVEFKDLPAMDPDVFVWCGGIRAPDVIAQMHLPLGAGKRVKVTPFLEAEGFPGIFAVGDSAALLDPYDAAPVPSTAQAALAMGPVAAANVLARVKDRKFRVFHYRPRGVAVAVGQGKAVAAVGARVLGGRLAGAIKGFTDREYHAEVKGVVT